MADDVLLPATGTGTADVTVATDQDTDNAHYQRIKLVDSADGSFVPLATAGETGGLAVRLLVEDTRLRRVLEEFLVAATASEPTKPPFPNALQTGHVTVSTSAVQIVPETGPGTAVIANYQSVDIYIGNPDVTTTTGFIVQAGATLSIEVAAPIFAVTASAYSAAGETDRVHVLLTYS